MVINPSVASLLVHYFSSGNVNTKRHGQQLVRLAITFSHRFISKGPFVSNNPHLHARKCSISNQKRRKVRDLLAALVAFY